MAHIPRADNCYSRLKTHHFAFRFLLPGFFLLHRYPLYQYIFPWGTFTKKDLNAPIIYGLKALDALEFH